MALSSASGLRSKSPVGVAALPVRSSIARSSFSGRSLQLVKPASGTSLSTLCRTYEDVLVHSHCKLRFLSSFVSGSG